MIASDSVTGSAAARERERFAARERRAILRGALVAFALLSLLAPRASAAADDQTPADRPTPVDELERQFQAVVERVAPSVVTIRVQRRAFAALPGAGAPDGAGVVSQILLVNGSGTIIAPDGLILTNEHVVQSAAAVEVTLFDGERRPARLVAADPRSDLAVLRIERGGLTPAPFVRWDDVRRGQWALTLGNPYGLGDDGQACFSAGVVSNLGRRLPGLGEVDDRFYGNMIQTTAAINPGSSGGGLFNLRGELIGVVTAMHTRATERDGVGFAIALTPIKRRIIERLARGEAIEYGFIGVQVRDPTPQERAAAGLREAIGAVVVEVTADGPADRGGLRAGDVLVEFDGQVVGSAADAAELIGAAGCGRRVSVGLRRDGSAATTEVQVARRAVSHVAWMRGESLLWRGMRIADISDDARRHVRVEASARGVVVIDIQADSPAAGAGLAIGDVIERVDGRAVGSVDAFERAVRDLEGRVPVTVSGRGERTIGP